MRRLLAAVLLLFGGPRVWADFNNMAGAEVGSLVELDANTGTVTAETSPVRTGGYAYKLAPSSTAEVYGSAIGTPVYWCHRFAFRVSYIGELTKIAEVGVNFIAAGPVLGTVELLATGKLKLTAGAQSGESSTTIAVDTYYVAEVRHSVSTQNDTTDLYINNTSEVNLSGHDQISLPKDIRFHNEMSSGRFVYIDDFYTETRSSGNVGAGQIEALRADADSGDAGEDEFQDQGAGSATYDDVSDTPTDDTTYAIESSQGDADHRQLWELSIHTMGLFDDSTPLDPEGVWTGDANAFDGDDATAATTNTGGTKDLNELQGDGVGITARTEAIASVVLIAKIGSTSVATTTHVEIFTDGRGESLGSVSINGNVTQTKRITLSVPSGGWSWAKVAALEAVCYVTQGGVGTASVYIVQVLVFAELAVDTINHVRIGLWAMRGSGSGTEHRIRSKVSTAENSADLGLTTGYAYYIFDPATQPSNQSELDSYQAGVWRNSGGREYYAADQWVMVDYALGAPPPPVARRLLLLGVGP
jgi:hypothetical protein